MIIQFIPLPSHHVPINVSTLWTSLLYFCLQYELVLSILFCIEKQSLFSRLPSLAFSASFCLFFSKGKEDGEQAKNVIRVNTGRCDIRWNIPGGGHYIKQHLKP